MADEKMLYDFSDAEAAVGWTAINDVVMGGVSSSAMETTEENTVLFAGQVSLENNGGFASVRAAIGPRDLSASEGLRIRARGDGRTYRLRLHNNAGMDGIAYQASFDTRSGEWQTVSLPFAAFQPTFRGRVPLNAPPLDTRQIEQVGLMIADGQAGPFTLEVDWVMTFGESAVSTVH